jgi:hypothetical protein
MVQVAEINVVEIRNQEILLGKMSLSSRSQDDLDRLS